MAHSAEQTIRTRYPLPNRTLPERISWKEARSVQRILVNAGIRCDLATHVGIGGGEDRPMFLGCTAAEVVAAARLLPALRVNWLKVVKAEQLILGSETAHAFTSPMLVWVPLKTAGA